MRRRTMWVALLALTGAGTTLHAQERVQEREDVEGRDAWFWSLRSFPFDERPYDKVSLLHQTLLDYLRRMSSRTTALTAPLGGAWRPIGPNGVWVSQIESGRIAAILPASTPGGPMYSAPRRAACGGARTTE